MGRYLCYKLKTLEPVRIADDSSSQMGQAKTLQYIPGSSIRGLIINSLCREEDFEKIKPVLFSSETKFLNAYPCAHGGKKNSEDEKECRDEKEFMLLPTPKGFYEDKAESILTNVVINGTFDDGMKRAKIGRYVRLDGDNIIGYSVRTGSDMKILNNVNDQKDRNVFRNEYIEPGICYAGYVYAEREDILQRIKDKLQGVVRIGNARSSGYGRCEVACDDLSEVPYQSCQVSTDLSGECYMMLLSNTTMLDKKGIPCGLDCNSLGSMLGVERLKIRYCATSTVMVRGYNRTWGTKIPAVMMYEAGSVFHFSFDGILKLDKMKELSRNGIGIRRNEGFGQVLFLRDYEKICRKQKGMELNHVSPEALEVKLSSRDENTLKQIAGMFYRNQIQEAMQRYILNDPLMKGTESSSRLGIIDSLATEYMYDPEEGVREIRSYYAHADEKESRQRVQQERGRMNIIGRHVLSVLDHPLEETLAIRTAQPDRVMGIPKKDLLDEEDETRMKLQFLVKEIRFDNKQEED